MEGAARSSTGRDRVSERSGAVAGAGAEWSGGGIPRGRTGAGAAGAAGAYRKGWSGQERSGGSIATQK